MQRKPAIFSLFLLAGTVGMATWVSWTKKSFPLADPMQPDGWAVRFAPPREWKPVFANTTDDAIAFETTHAEGTRHLLIVERLVNSDRLTPDSLALMYLRRLTHPGLRGLFAPPVLTVPTEMGPLPGAFAEDFERGILVMAGLVDGVGYCISLVVDPPRSRRDVELLTAVASSVQLVRNN